MLGIILIYVLGKYFYKLADKYNKGKWLYAILGIISYYFGATIIGGIVLVLLDLLFELDLNWDNNSGLSLLIMPFGIVTSYLLYYLLKRQWSKSAIVTKDEIQDIGKDQEDIEME